MSPVETDPDCLKEQLRLAAASLGFDAFGVTTPDAIPEAVIRLQVFLSEGCHGDMNWLEANADRRGDPRKLWPEARSVVMVAMSYAPASDPLRALGDSGNAIISVYAKGRDYHDVLKGRLKQLAQRIANEGAGVKVFVDTAPLMEKPLAAAAGLGWQGKHTNLVSRAHGSWLFLGAILTTAEMPIDQPEQDHCGTCSRCIDICPTAAIPAPYRLDARRCIAYLTIEFKRHIPREFRAAIGNRVFGCDDCLAVCPWNKFAVQSREAKFAAKADLDNPPLTDIIALDDEAFRKRFAGTPVKRTGRDRVVRNALIAAGNTRDPALYEAVAKLATDESALVRAMVAWAAPQLGEVDMVAALRAEALSQEKDPAVIAEWMAEERNQ